MIDINLTLKKGVDIKINLNMKIENILNISMNDRGKIKRNMTQLIC